MGAVLYNEKFSTQLCPECQLDSRIRGPSRTERWSRIVVVTVRRERRWTSAVASPAAITAGASRVASGLLYVHAVAITPAGSMEHVRSSLSIVGGLPRGKVGSAPATVFSGPAQRSLTLRPARSRSRQATLYVESSDSFVASAAASIASGWSEPVPGSTGNSRETGREPLFSMEDAAKYLGMSTKWMYRNYKTLAHIPIGSGPKPRIKFRRCDLDAWVRRHRIQ